MNTKESLAEKLFQISSCHVPETKKTGDLSQASFADVMLHAFVRDWFKGGQQTAVYQPDHFTGFITVYDAAEKRTVVFGPALTFRPSDFSKSGYAERYEIRPSRRKKYYEYLAGLPLYSPAELLSIALHLHEQINGTAIEPEKIRLFDNTWNRNLENPAEQSAFADFAEENYRELQESQQLIYHCIREGKPDQLSQALRSRKMSFHLGLLRDPLANYKATASLALSLAMQAAVDGGLDYAVALHTFDLFSLYLERVTNVREVLNLTAAAQQEYAQRVEQIRVPEGCPASLAKAIRYIGQHLHEPLTAEGIARETNTSQTYVSKLFVRHLGLSISEYIRQRKTEEAQRLLRQTELSIASISYRLGFPSQSQFQKVFKRCAGVTPHQYRLHREESLE